MMRTEELIARQIVLESLLMVTLTEVGRADFKTFDANDWAAFLDAIRVRAIGRLHQEELPNEARTAGLTYADYLLSTFAGPDRPR
jgi:hypothetical protein